jgi:rare lipoprotein A (peptidoglycan hydrolase)
MRLHRFKSTIPLALGATIACATLGLLTGGNALAASSMAAGGAAAPSGTKAKKMAPTGIATWFGPGFYGQKTACGQTLTPAVVGVANRTLPCGTLVQISYLGHSLVVPVLDRGPYAHNGASWDLTAGAANALAVTETARIDTRVVGKAPNTPTLGAPPVTPAEELAGGAQAG